MFFSFSVIQYYIRLLSDANTIGLRSPRFQWSPPAGGFSSRRNSVGERTGLACSLQRRAAKSSSPLEESGNPPESPRGPCALPKLFMLRPRLVSISSMCPRRNFTMLAHAVSSNRKDGWPQPLGGWHFSPRKLVGSARSTDCRNLSGQRRVPTPAAIARICPFDGPC